VVESSALLKRRSSKGYRGFESLPHRFHSHPPCVAAFFPDWRTINLAGYDGWIIMKITSMNWEMISAVGQMLGAIGVNISIVYLPLKSGTKQRKANVQR
jgi:hypothetical protein